MCASVGMMQSKTEQWLIPSAALKKTYHAKSTQHACVREQDRKTQRENLKWELYSWQLVVPAYGQSTRSSVDSATRGTTQLPPHTALRGPPLLHQLIKCCSLYSFCKELQNTTKRLISLESLCSDE